MKRLYIFLIIQILCCHLSAQPTSFSWASRHGNSYISAAKNQKVQGPCSIFAAVAGVEAMAQIYFNKLGASLDLSERYLYNAGGECPGFGCESPASILETLGLFSTSGVIDESCFPFPSSEPYCSDECDNICSSPSNEVTIPYHERVYPSNATDLKTYIMNYGPLVVNLLNVGCDLHPNAYPCNYNHSVLLVGWDNSTWHIKDSWPNEYSLYYTPLNIFSYSPSFYRIYPVYNSTTMDCEGSDCSIFNSRYYVDSDQDGFYNWGLDSSTKPAGCPGPDKMDFNDNASLYIFWDGTNVLPAPYISGTSGAVCQSGSEFTLNNIPPGFSCNWEVSQNAYCFNSPISGSGSSVTLYPNSSCVGKEAEITFNITNNGTASYKKSFYVNCPREDQTSVSILDSYGSSVDYVCPYQNYTVYFHNNDFNCPTSDFEWYLSSGWTENYSWSNYMSFNANDTYYGYVEIWAKTSCSPGTRIHLYTLYLGYGYCEDFLLYPNPSSNYVNIELNKQNLSMGNPNTDFECIVSIVDKSGITKFSNKINAFPYRLDTSNLPKGIYFINFQYNNKLYSTRLVIER
jgi:hypothetical protein